MKLLGLTGGIGMGKTAAGQWLLSRGVPVVDSDALARQVVEPGQPACNEIQAVFGKEIVAPGGGLNRDRLARIVFSDAAARRRLEEITHPRIRQLWQQQTATWREEGRPLGVVVIPLLFETGAEAEVDATLCVACSAASQRQRLLDRGWSLDEIARRIAAQWPVENKMALSDFLVWTEGGLGILGSQLERILGGAS